MADNGYDSFLAAIREREEAEQRERRERRSLDSGFGAFDKWDSRLSFRSRLRSILDGVDADMKGDELRPAESKLRELEWAGTETCLVYSLDGTYDPKTVTLDKLQGRDRTLADLVRGIYDGYDGRKFLVTLMTFERRVTGDRTTTTLSKKRTSNDRKVFMGYDTFTCIESDEIGVCKWSPLEREGVGYASSVKGLSVLKDSDNEMFIGGILNEGGLRSMFIGRSPDESDFNSCTFYRSAIVICPTENAIKLDDASPMTYRTWWVLREGCLVAPRALQGSVKDQIAHRVMRQIRELTTKEHLVSGSTYLYRSQLDIALDILVDAGRWEWVLEFISTLANAVKDWPNKEKVFSDFISEAMIRLHSGSAILEER